MKIIKLLITIAFLVPALVIGETQDQFYEKYHSKNMSGWKGIVFVCSFDSGDKILEKICDRAVIDTELLAASHKVNFKVVEANKSGDEVFFSAVNKFLTLKYELIATQGVGQFDTKAIHARLTFVVFYSNAVEKDAKPNSIDSLPRMGDLELWSKTLIGSGAPTDIVDPFSNEAEGLIKKALTLFIKFSK
jgi:hypothetical protein